MKIISFFLFIFGIYIAACFYLYFIQNQKIFNRKWAKSYIPKKAKIIYFKTSDGIKLEGAFIKNGNNLPLVLYFGGNANNVIEFLDKIAPEIKEFNFLGFNYPGYARSEGKPSEKKILKYASEIFKKYKPDFVIGRSLGTAIAAYLASKYKFKGLLLITPFDSIEHIAKIRYPIFPIDLLLKYKFNEAKFIKRSKIPVIVIALKNDDIIPKISLENLLNNIQNLKKIIWLDGVKHGEIYTYPNIYKIIQNSLEKLNKNER